MGILSIILFIGGFFMGKKKMIGTILLVILIILGMLGANYTQGMQHYQELDFEICDSSQIDPYLKIETEDLK